MQRASNIIKISGQMCTIIAFIVVLSFSAPGILDAQSNTRRTTTTTYRPVFTTTTNPTTYNPRVQPSTGNTYYNMCPPIRPKQGVTVSCYRPETQETMSCDRLVNPGVEVRYGCDEFHTPSGRFPAAFSTCTRDGKWTSERALTCNPRCGLTSRQSLVVSFVNRKEPSQQHGEWPWHAALFTREGSAWEYHCGGTLISERAVLTAAQCVTNTTGTRTPMDTRNMVVALGKQESKYTDENGMSQLIEPKSFYIASEYKTFPLQNDLAIITLKAPARISENIRPACFPLDYEEDELIANSYGVVTGWGVTESGKLSESRQVVRVPVINETSCADHLREINQDYRESGFYCAGIDNGTNVCAGHGGGGMVFPEDSQSGPVYYVRGVASFGITKGGPNKCFPSYFTRVSKFSLWIVRILSRIEKE